MAADPSQWTVVSPGYTVGGVQISDCDGVIWTPMCIGRTQGFKRADFESKTDYLIYIRLWADQELRKSGQGDKVELELQKAQNAHLADLLKRGRRRQRQLEQEIEAGQTPER